MVSLLIDHSYMHPVICGVRYVSLSHPMAKSSPGSAKPPATHIFAIKTAPIESKKTKKKTKLCWARKLPTLDHISFKQFQHVATWSTDRVTTCRYSHFILHPLHHGSLCCNRVAALKLRHRGDSLLNQQDLILVARAVLQSVRHQPGTFRGPTLTLSKLMAFRNT